MKVMKNTWNVLEAELKKAGCFLDEEGKLLKQKIINYALDESEESVNLQIILDILLSNDELRKVYFNEIKGNKVFLRDKFIKTIAHKEFLPCSYTTFMDYIGLSVDGDLIKKSKDVVLAFPYKDCILEGGQTKEEQKMKEVFYNETLANDEIDRLLSPKAFKNIVKYSKEGQGDLFPLKEEKINKFNDKENLLIKGNNLLALHSIADKYKGKIKLIYIDPPYNTENDSFGYNDKFNHSSWLVFMKNRLKIARKLLREDGIIFLQLDDKEIHYCKVLMDEIFDRNNFLAYISYERSGVSGLGQGGQFVVNTSEGILAYAKQKPQFKANILSGEFPFEYKDMKRYNKILIESGKREEVARFVAASTGEEVVIYKHTEEKIATISLADFNNRKEEIKKIYIENFDNIYRNTSVQAENEFQAKILSYCNDGFYSADYTVSRGRKKGEKITAYYVNGQVFAWLKDTAKIEEGEIIKTNKLSDFWTHAEIPKADLSNEGGVSLRRGKKPENLLKRIIELGSQENDIILDFFGGSGTTPAVSHKLKRQYIAIEQLDYGFNDPLKRLINVLNGEQSGISQAESVKWKGGGSFVYLELAEENSKYMDLIDKCSTKEMLAELKQEISKNAVIRYEVEDEFVFNGNGKFNELTLEQQKEVLKKILDKNHLYINYSEIKDKKYSFTEDELKFNHSFYGKEND